MCDQHSSIVPHAGLAASAHAELRDLEGFEGLTEAPIQGSVLSMSCLICIYDRNVKVFQ